MKSKQEVSVNGKEEKKEREDIWKLKQVENSQTIKKVSNDIILSFSRGKDSIVSWLVLLELGFKVHPIYYSLCPYMDFELKSLSYYEDFFKTEIIKIPSATFIDLYNFGHLQTKSHTKISQKNQMPYYDNDQIRQMAIGENGINKNSFIAVGATIFDSVQRRIGISKVNGLNVKSKKFYPIADFNQSKIEEYLIKYKVKLPVDYKVWGSTFDGLNLRWLGELKEHFPKDFELLKTYFPFIEAELFRKEMLNLWSNKSIENKINKWSKYC